MDRGGGTGTGGGSNKGCILIGSRDNSGGKRGSGSFQVPKGAGTIRAP